MKRLDEILPKTAANVTSEGPSDISLSTSEEPAQAECPRCGGAGFVRIERAVDHPRFGKAEPCECVLDEADDARYARLQRVSNIGSLARFRFDSLIPSGRGADNPRFRAAFEAAHRYAHSPEGWLVLSGGSGTGKTHLAAAIANERIARGEPPLFMVVPDLLDRLRASFDAAPGDLGFENLFEHVRTAPLLILDDLDAVAFTPWSQEKLLQIVNHRYNAALPTVFTSSERPSHLEGRFASRLCDPSLSHIYELDGARQGRYVEVGGMTRERLSDFQFRNFELALPGLTPDESASLRAAFRAAAAFAEAPRGFFTLLGDSGCGKTHLAAAVANAALGREQSVGFVFVPDLLDRLRAAQRPSSDTDDLLALIREVDLLVLDDLGGHNATPWAQEKLFQIVNYRSLSGGATIVTREGELEGLDRRVAGRLTDPRNGNITVILAPHYTLGRAPAPQRQPRARNR